MPEGHVTHGIARDLRRDFGHRPVRVTSPQGRFADGAALLDGRSIRRAEAWGKYLFVAFAPDRVLHVHLGLIGKFRPVPAAQPPPGTVRVRIEDTSVAWQLTGPNRCDVLTRAEVRAIISTLGPDPLRRNADPAAFAVRLRSRSAPVGAVLLDQTVIAGIGNVFRAELLFIEGIHPIQPASSLREDQVSRLWAQAVFQLRRALKLRRIVTTDPVEIGRSVGRMRDEDRLYVYHREHCRRCGSELVTLQLGGRPMQYCPVHQPLVGRARGC
jgi:endonuclease VIII